VWQKFTPPKELGINADYWVIIHNAEKREGEGKKEKKLNTRKQSSMIEERRLRKT